MDQTKLILLFDGACPLCQREVTFLRSKDRLNVISFVDIDSPSYNPEFFRGISYKEAMGQIHAITDTGEILKDIAVFREAYRLVGLGWIYSPTSLPILAPLFDKAYRFWAGWRLAITGRPPLEQLCKLREIN